MGWGLVLENERRIGEGWLGTHLRPRIGLFSGLDHRRPTSHNWICHLGVNNRALEVLVGLLSGEMRGCGSGGVFFGVTW